MKRFRRQLNRIIAVVLVVLFAGGVLADTGINSRAEAEGAGFEESFFLPEAETSAMPIGFFSLDDGMVELAKGSYAEWIDRLDLSGAEVIREFYDKLVEASDNDGVDDFLIEDSYYAGDSRILVAQVPGVAVTTDEISAAASEIMSHYAAYIQAACNAFDRDHPEVFWLSGSNAYGYSCSYSSGAGGYEYTVSISYILKGTVGGQPFEVRAAEYQSEEAIKADIAARDLRVNELITAAEGMSTYAQIQYFNEQLTYTNQYNTSADLNIIAHNCRECISALSGSTGETGPVCEGYARAFKVLCDKAGIPCILSDGQAYNGTGSEAHMWNYVKIGGMWYGMDVTWNDPVSYADVEGDAVSGHENEQYLLVGAETVIGGMTFAESHQVANRVSGTGVAFINGPEISAEAFDPSTFVIEDVSDQIVLQVSDLVYGEKLSFEKSLSSAVNGTPLWSYQISDDGTTYKAEEEFYVAGGYLPAGEYTLQVNYEDDGQIGQVTAGFCVDAKEIIITPGANQGKTYGDSEPKEFAYHTSEALVGTDTFQGALARTAGEDVGTYTYSLGTLAVNDNYKLVFAADAPCFVITPKHIDSVSVSVAAPKAGNVPQSSVAAGEGYTGSIQWSGNPESFAHNTVYTAEVTLIADVNHVFSDTTTAEGFAVTYNSNGSLTLTREFDVTNAMSKGSGSVSMESWIYDGTAKNSPTVTSDTNGTANVTYYYESTDGKGYSSSEIPINAGVYKVTASFAANDIYTACTAEATFAIEAVDISGAEITLTDSLTYNGMEQAQAVAAIIVNGLEVTYELSGHIQKDAGSYALMVTGTGNFTGSVKKPYHISPKEVIVPDITTDYVVVGESTEAEAVFYWQNPIIEGVIGGDDLFVTVTAELANGAIARILGVQLVDGVHGRAANYALVYDTE